jgi:hypothetical protein
MTEGALDDDLEPSVSGRRRAPGDLEARTCQVHQTHAVDRRLAGEGASVRRGRRGWTERDSVDHQMIGEGTSSFRDPDMGGVRVPVKVVDVLEGIRPGRIDEKEAARRVAEAASDPTVRRQRRPGKARRIPTPEEGHIAPGREQGAIGECVETAPGSAQLPTGEVGGAASPVHQFDELILVGISKTVTVGITLRTGGRIHQHFVDDHIGLRGCGWNRARTSPGGHGSERQSQKQQHGRGGCASAHVHRCSPFATPRGKESSKRGFGGTLKGDRSGERDRSEG